MLEGTRGFMPATAVKGRPITAEDLFNINVVSDPQASPDGSLVAYVVTTADKERDGYRSAIWITPTGEGEPWMLTSGAFRDSSPRWSPDGRTIAFVSDRPLMTPVSRDNEDDKAEHKESGKNAKNDNAGNGKQPSQIWTIAVAGGEARQLTTQEFGAESPAWSPDGRTIAFIGQTEFEGDESAPQKVADERIVTKIRYRFNGIGFIDRYRHLFTIPATGGEARQLTSGDYQNSQPAWTPDGKSIVFVSNRRQDRHRSSASTIFAIKEDGGEPLQLADDDASFANPSVSPDGTRVAFTGHLDFQAGSSKTVELWTASINGGDLTSHSATYDRSMSDAGMSDIYFGSDSRPVWRSSQAVCALSSSEGATAIVEVDLDKDDVTMVIDGARRIIAFTPVSDGRVVFGVGDMSHPFELFIANADGGNERQLTHHNRAWLDEVSLSAPIALDVTAADGQKIQAWVLPPYGFKEGGSEKHPLVLQIHGGPHGMYGNAMFHEMQLMTAKGYAVLFCNPRGSVGYGEEFAATTRGRWGESDMPDVMAAVDAALALGWIDQERLGVTGGSYGGYLTNWIVGHTDRFKAAVTQRCVANFHSFFGTSDIGYDFGEHEFGGVPWANSAKLLRYSPISYVDKITTPLLIVHGEQDLRCPIEQAEQMFVALKYLGREVEFVRIPDENHELSRSGTPSRRLARLHHLIGWFERHMPACEPDERR